MTQSTEFEARRFLLVHILPTFYGVFFMISLPKGIVSVITSLIHDKHLLKIAFTPSTPSQSGARKINKWQKRDKKKRPALKKLYF